MPSCLARPRVAQCSRKVALFALPVCTISCPFIVLRYEDIREALILRVQEARDRGSDVVPLSAADKRIIITHAVGNVHAGLAASQGFWRSFIATGTWVRVVSFACARACAVGAFAGGPGAVAQADNTLGLVRANVQDRLECPPRCFSVVPMFAVVLSYRFQLTACSSRLTLRWRG